MSSRSVGNRSNASSTVARRFAVTIPSRLPSARRTGSRSRTPSKDSSVAWSGSLWARYTSTSSSTRSGSRSRIWATSPGPPIAARTSSSSGSRPSTVTAACLIEARMIGPESIRVPSRSNRTTRKRMWSIVAPHIRCPTSVGHHRFARGVLHSLEVQPTGRRRHPGLCPRTALEELPDTLGADLEHRPDERAHHVPQERVGRNGEVKLVPAPFPRGRADLPAEDLVLGFRRRERREVVLAEKQRRAGVQGGLVERSRPPERATSAKRRAFATGQHDVAVRASGRAESSVEAVWRLLCADDADVARKSGVERLREPRDRWAGVRVEARDLAGRVHAGVRAAGDRKPAPAGKHGVECLPDGPFDGSRAGLPRPALEVAAVVLERETQCRHIVLVTDCYLCGSTSST